MDVRIVGIDLPGRAWGDLGPGGCPYRNIHVGVQRRREVVETFPGDADRAVWDLTVDVVDAGGEVDLRGPYVQGRRGARFLYLSWGTVDEDGRFEMFRRAKLMLDALDGPTVRAAARPGMRLEATVGLTGPKGSPRCAALRPPAVEWTVAPA